MAAQASLPQQDRRSPCSPMFRNLISKVVALLLQWMPPQLQGSSMVAAVQPKYRQAAMVALKLVMVLDQLSRAAPKLLEPPVCLAAFKLAVTAVSIEHVHTTCGDLGCSATA